MPLCAIPHTLLALLLGGFALGAGTAWGQEGERQSTPQSAVPTGEGVCADPWYGGCPDSCTQSFRRLQNRNALNERRLEEWAERCLKREEQEEGEQRERQQAGGEAEGETAEQAQAQEAAESAPSQQQADAASGAQEAAESPSSQQQADAASGAEDGSPESTQEQAQASSGAAGEAQAAAGEQGEERSAAAGGQDEAAAQEQAQAQAQSQAQAQAQAQAGGGEQPQDAPAQEAPPPRGPAAPEQAESPQDGEQAPSGSAEAEAGEEGSAAPAQAGPIAQMPEQRREQAETAPSGDPRADTAQSERAGAPAEARGPSAAQQQARSREAARSGSGTGEELQTPLPPGQSSTGRPYTPFEQRQADRRDRFGGLLERAGVACSMARAPMCGGSCRAGVCAPSAAGGGCRCRPAVTPESADHRRRALCAIPGQDRLAVAICRPASPGVAASCAVSGGTESRLCDTLWSVPYREIGVLAGGRPDLDLRLDPVPVWDWARPGEAVDRVAVPLGASGKSLHPRGVWESAEDPLPASDVRLLVGSKSTGEVAVLGPDGEGGVRVSETELRRTQLVTGCEEEEGDVCAREQLARLRLTLVAQVPDSRILATHTDQGARWYGECAAYASGEEARAICYQLRSDGTDAARAWHPLRLDWLGDGAETSYARALLDAPEDRSDIETSFFRRAAAVQGSAPPLLLAVASEEAERAYLAGGLPAAGAPDETTPAGMLALEGERLTRIGADGPSELPPRTRAMLLRAIADPEGIEGPVAARLAAAATLDGDAIILTRVSGSGACLLRSRPRGEIVCLQQDDEPAIWRPLAWPAEGPAPRIGREELLAAAERAGEVTQARLGEPALDLILSAAAAPEGRYLRAFDIFRATAGEDPGGQDWAGLVLGFRRADEQSDPLFAGCVEDAAFLSERRRSPLAAPLRLLRPEDGRSCAEAFAPTYEAHRRALHDRLARNLPAEITALTLHDSRALLESRSPAGRDMVELWSANPDVRRVFAPVTARCLMDRAGAAADLAPGGDPPGQEALERALLSEDWRALGWRANPLGLLLRAQSCEEGV